MPKRERPTTSSREMDLGGWVLRIGVGAAFVLAGYSKLLTGPHAGWVKMFEQIGLGAWFRPFTGAWECLGGILFVFPRTMKFGVALMVSAMIGAIIAHMTVLHDPFSSIIPLMIIAGVVVVALREDDRDEFRFMNR